MLPDQQRGVGYIFLIDLLTNLPEVEVHFFAPVLRISTLAPLRGGHLVCR